MSQVTHLASGALNRSGDTLTVELIQPDSMPAVVPIVWPAAATITTPARYLEVASTAMRLLAEAFTTLARIKPASDGNGLAWAGRPQVFQDFAPPPPAHEHHAEPAAGATAPDTPSSASHNISQPFDSATPSTARRWTSMLTPLLACSTEIDLDSRLGCQGD